MKIGVICLHKFKYRESKSRGQDGGDVYEMRDLLLSIANQLLCLWELIESLYCIARVGDNEIH